MQSGSFRRMRRPAILILILVGIAAEGVGSVAQAQLLPNAPITRQRPSCDQELPVYKQYRAVYYGYHPTCWRAFPPGWGCPSPAKGNVAESYAKLPLGKPAAGEDGETGDGTGDEPGLDKDKASADDKTEEEPSIPEDGMLDENKRPADPDNAATPPDAGNGNANPNANGNGNGNAEEKKTGEGLDTTSLPPLPPQLRSQPSRGLVEPLPPLPPGYSNVPTTPVAVDPNQGYRPSAPATSARPTFRDAGLVAAAGANFDYHAGQSDFIPRQPQLQPAQRQAQPQRKFGLLQGLFGGRNRGR